MRSNYNGELRKENIGNNVTLYGWVNKIRALGGLMFIDLRDISGIVQLVCKPGTEAFRVSEELTPESVIEVKGVVEAREAINSKIPTGDVEVIVDEIKILNKSLPLPIDKNSSDELKLKYRYLDLRREDLQNTFKVKTQLLACVRDYLNTNHFIECETPILCKSTPEGARDYLVPSRIYKGMFYALPQSPQVLKQLLMVAGFDRYYQIAKCFRDEDLRSDRQPEFTQIDIETSFLEQDELLSLIEGMIKKIWKDILGIEFDYDFPKMEYDHALRYYGSDKPDTRFGLEFEDFSFLRANESPLLANKHIFGIRIDSAQAITRKVIDELTDECKKHGGDNLFFLRMANGEVSGSITKLLSQDEIAKFNLSNDQLILMTSHVKERKAQVGLCAVRLSVGEKLNLIDKNKFDFKWIINFPLFELTDDGEITSTHHPFTRPLERDLKYLDTDPLKVYSASYDLVCCGYEVGGGSLRIYDSVVQAKMFDILKINKEQQQLKFGYLLDAFKYGCPPHGGLAFGLERLLMILTGKSNIRDVILFPKTTSAQDMMLDSPSGVDPQQLKDLGLL